MEELYSKYNILTTFKDNKNITLSVEPPLVATQKNIDYFIKSLGKILDGNISKLVFKIIKNKIIS